MEQLLKSANEVFVLENKENKNFCALFFLRNNSTLFHCIPVLEKAEKNPCDESEINEIKKLLKKFILKLNIFCVYGEFSGTNFINSILVENKKNLIAAKEYYFMENDFSHAIYSTQIKQYNKLNIRKCATGDLEKLFSLEKGYREEEVKVAGHEESDKTVNFVLSKSLATQHVFAAFDFDGANEKAIAKSQTNACGKKYFQIGGVYCRPEFRSRKITYDVMRHLLEFIRSQNKKPVLFVNVINEPAKKLYKNLGFTETGKYMISYFQNDI